MFIYLFFVFVFAVDWIVTSMQGLDCQSVVGVYMYSYFPKNFILKIAFRQFFTVIK